MAASDSDGGGRLSSRACRAWLSVLVLAWGAQAIVTQSLLLREALVLMFGSEFAWGVVLFAWLLGVAVGAAVGAWAAETVFRGSRAALGLARSSAPQPPAAEWLAEVPRGRPVTPQVGSIEHINTNCCAFHLDFRRYME